MLCRDPRFPIRKACDHDSPFGLHLKTLAPTEARVKGGDKIIHLRLCKLAESLFKLLCEIRA